MKLYMPIQFGFSSCFKTQSCMCGARRTSRRGLHQKGTQSLPKLLDVPYFSTACFPTVLLCRPMYDEEAGIHFLPDSPRPLCSALLLRWTRRIGLHSPGHWNCGDSCPLCEPSEVRAICPPLPWASVLIWPFRMSSFSETTSNMVFHNYWTTARTICASEVWFKSPCFWGFCQTLLTLNKI